MGTYLQQKKWSFIMFPYDNINCMRFVHIQTSFEYLKNKCERAQASVLCGGKK